MSVNFDPASSEDAYFLVLEGVRVGGPFWTRDVAETAERIALQYGELDPSDDYAIEVGTVEE